MTTRDWEASLANDPLSVRLSRIETPPASPELMAKVLSRTHALKARRLRARHALILFVGLAAGLSTIAFTPAGAFVGRAVLPPGMQQRFGILTGAPETIPHPGPNDCAVYAGAPNTTTATFTRHGVTGTEMTRKCKNGQTITSWGYRPPILDLTQAQGLVDFRIRIATWVPDSLQLVGIRMYPKPPDFSDYDQRAAVVYKQADSSSGASTASVTIDEKPGSPVGGPAVPASAAHTVHINGLPAVYVHGSYENKPGGPGQWNANADTAELSWQADGITYHLTATGPGLSESDLVQIAASIR